MTRHHIAIRCVYDTPNGAPIGFSWISALLLSPNSHTYQITLWCAGDCLKYLLTSYESLYGTCNPHLVFLNKIIQAGGKIMVCGLEAQTRNLSLENFHSFVTVVPLAVDYMISYQEKTHRFVIYDHQL